MRILLLCLISAFLAPKPAFAGCDKELRIQNRVPSKSRPSLEEASEIARGLGIRSRREYVAMARAGLLREGLPIFPDNVYKNWPGWPKFLNRPLGLGSLGQIAPPKFYPPYDQVKAWALANGITSSTAWGALYAEGKLPPEFPLSVKTAYPDQFQNWDDFLDRTRPYDYFEACAWARQQGFKSSREYQDAVRAGLAPAGLPVSANTVYAFHWESWDVFLGKRPPAGP